MPRSWQDRRAELIRREAVIQGYFGRSLELLSLVCTQGIHEGGQETLVLGHCHLFLWTVLLVRLSVTQAGVILESWLYTTSRRCSRKEKLRLRGSDIV